MQGGRKPRKVLVLGSGPIKIAEAAEFDYSGSQALKVLREEGIKSVLINPNIATSQTSYASADRIYMLPVNAEMAEKVIASEKPDAILMGFGGQTALSCGIDLYESGVLEKYGIKVLGTQVKGIKSALSREEFRRLMVKIKIPVPPSASAKTAKEALAAAKKIGYPVMMRVSFNLGGRGSAVAKNSTELEAELKRAFANSSINEVLVEKYLKGWKEIEYEVMRDAYGNAAVTACIENLDPMGVHTGESVAVSPSQTLDNHEFQDMRTMAIRVAESISLVGECNVQFALDPRSYRFYVIETNPRMSRSSALASKATGYPLAYVSAKLALGYTLYEVKNLISKATTSFFEPSMDYIIVKMPRWDLKKFEGVSNTLGTEMKSIGEVMAIGRNFTEAFQKAVRMLDIDASGIKNEIYESKMQRGEIISALKAHKPYWFFYAMKAIKEGMQVKEVSMHSGVDIFYISKLEELVERATEQSLKRKKLSPQEMHNMKRLGFLDSELGCSTPSPAIKQIDTLAGEFPASANYLYTTYDGTYNDIKPKSSIPDGLLVMGAGVFRIGVSVEFDWSAMAIASSAKKYFDRVAMINYNPETVSTDWDNFKELYFEELNEETVSKLYKMGKFSAVATFAGGQIGNSLSKTLESKGIKLLGTKGASVDIAEDREKFSMLAERLGIWQPEWIAAKTMSEVSKFANEVGFPLMVRPSYVLGGTSMFIANNLEELQDYIRGGALLSKSHPAVISKFIKGVEAEMDCASDGSNVMGITMQHIEETGVHSGDATILTPFNDASMPYGTMSEYALRFANELSIKGPFNIQFAVANGMPYVIELNLRASRSMPFSSKSVGINLIEHAVDGIFSKYKKSGFFEPKHMAYAVKSPQFAWSQLRGSYPILGPDMRSTGESAAYGYTIEDALLKSWLGVQPNKIPSNGVLVYGESNTKQLGRSALLFEKLGINTYTLEIHPISGTTGQLTIPAAIDAINRKRIDAIFTNGNMKSTDYKLRRYAADMNLPLVLNGRLGLALSKAFGSKLSYKEMSDYIINGKKQVGARARRN